MDFDWNCLLDKSQPSQFICTPRCRRCKIRCSRKSVLTTFSGFIGLCRVSIMQYMELLDKKLTGPRPEILVHPGVTLFSVSLSLFVTFSLTENRKDACFTGEYSTLTNRLSSDLNLHRIALVLSVALISCIPCCFMNHEKRNKRIHYSANLTNKGNKVISIMFLRAYGFVNVLTLSCLGSLWFCTHPYYSLNSCVFILSVVYFYSERPPLSKILYFIFGQFLQ